MSMFWIAGSTVSSAGQSFTFSSIPQTFTHLQLRVFGRSTGTSGAPFNAYVNTFNGGGSLSGSYHRLAGDGGSAFSNSGTTAYSIPIGYTIGTSQLANTFTAFIVDILDYTNTNKNKTVKSLAGFDMNGAGGYVSLQSGLLVNLGTAAISSFNVVTDGTGFDVGSRAELYGIQSSTVTGA